MTGSSIGATRSRLLAAALAALALCCATPSSLRAENVYIAFGDSITRAGGGPVNPNTIFDNGACSDAQLDQCACARRITNDLSDGTVLNEGWGAERTDAGLARLDGVLDTHCGSKDPGDCVALLLMEGTNNVTQINKGKAGYSIESTIQDLESMIDVATDHGVDVVLGSVPQRATWSGCDATGHDATTDELNDEIEALASDAGRTFANVAQHPQDGLCKNSNTCFQNHYYCDDLHLDPSGYDRLCDIFLGRIESQALPPTPTPIAPTGVITDAAPDFEWAETLRTNWYQVEIDGDSSWHEETICGGGTCSISAGALTEGAHSWRVRARNLLGYGPWSESFEFDLYLSAPQAAPEPLSPNATIFKKKPLYRWRTTASAETYTLEVKDEAGNVEVSVTDLPASDLCADGLCEYREGTALPVDTYTWTVQAANPLGAGPTSTALAFETLPCTDDSPREAEDLLPSPITGTETIEWCGPITVGGTGPYVVEPSAHLTLHSRESVEFKDAFEGSGGLAVRVDD